MTFILRYRRLVCGSLETLKFDIKHHYNRQVKYEMSTHFRGRLKDSLQTIGENLETPNVG